MSLECGINRGHHLFSDSLLNVNRFEKARESGAEDGMHGVGIMESNEGCINVFGFKVAQEHCGYGSHTLAISTLFAPKRKAMQDVEQGSLSADREESMHRWLLNQHRDRKSQQKDDAHP